MSDTVEDGTKKKRKVGRSPAYPFINVKKALDQAKALMKQEGEYFAPLSSAVGAWGYSEKSSGGRQTLATMKYYGLIEIEGNGAQRKIKVSDLARRILLDQREDETEKKGLIRKVALSPVAHQAIYDQYPNGLASDGSVTHFLMFDMGFKSDAASELLAEFKETADYAELYQPQNSADKNDDTGDNGGDVNDPPKVQIGDKIQWTSQGVERFPDGATVLGLSDDGNWVFTDQGKVAAAISEVTVMEQSASTSTLGVPPEPPAHVVAAMALAKQAKRQQEEVEAKPGSRKAVFPVEDGDVTLIFPESISSDGLEELGQYLYIFLKKERNKKESE